MKTLLLRVNPALLALLAFALGALTLGSVAEANQGREAGKAITAHHGSGGNDDDNDGKVRICHFPPGNPGNVHLISVGPRAVPAHMAHFDAVCAAASDKNCCFHTASSPSLCTGFTTDNNNCGACGNVCAPGTTCSGGTCANICPPPSVFCGASGCVSPTSDNNNCGTCGNVCAPPTACAGGVCTNICSGVCAPGTTFCTASGRCENTQTDENNCGTCGNVCAPGETCAAGVCSPPCAAGETLCGTTCVDTQTDENNCGTCGNVCDSADTCIAGECTPPDIVNSCLPTSSLSVLIQGLNVTAYVPRGSWSERVVPTNEGVRVVRLEGAPGASTTVATGVVNSCSSNGTTGTTVCTGNNNDVYVINGSTLATTTAGATGTQQFSGGSCMTCGVAFDAETNLAWIAEGTDDTDPNTGQLQSFNPSGPTFGTPIGLFGQKTSENIAIDPVRNLILSAAYNTNIFQVINSASGAVYNSTTAFPSPGVPSALLDSTAEDCSTGIALAPYEFAQTVLLINLSGATYTPGLPGSPGTFTAPFNIQDFSPDFANLTAGNSGSAVAPGSNLAVITGEFGGTGFGVLQLPSSIGPATVPAATDWVSSNVTTDPSGAPWNMGLDPHTVTAYVSPNNNKAYALMSNLARTYLVKVDMALLLSAPRLPAPASHTADPATIPAGTFTFVAQ